MPDFDSLFDVLYDYCNKNVHSDYVGRYAFELTTIITEIWPLIGEDEFAEVIQFIEEIKGR